MLFVGRITVVPVETVLTEVHDFLRIPEDIDGFLAEGVLSVLFEILNILLLFEFATVRWKGFSSEFYYLMTVSSSVLSYVSDLILAKELFFLEDCLSDFKSEAGSEIDEIKASGASGSDPL